MNKTRIPIGLFITLLLMIIMVPSMKAQKVTIDATIDSAQITIGEQAKIKLEVSANAQSKIDFKQYKDTIIKGLEVVGEVKKDTQYLNDKKRILLTRQYTVTSFDSALYYIPPFEVLVDSVTYQSKTLALKVYNSIPDTLKAGDYFGEKEIMHPAFKWGDIAMAVYLFLGLIPLVGLVVYLLKQFIRNKPIIRHIWIDPPQPPYQKALCKIKEIKEGKVWQHHSHKEYYSQLTDAVRTYMEERFSLNAMEMTTAEIVDAIQKVEDIKCVEELRELFETADLVKFAKHEPMINENDMNLVNAIEFIDHTKREYTEEELQPKEVTKVEHRSLRYRVILMSIIVALSSASITALYFIIRDIYRLFF
jgi:competence protein ComGC